MTKKDYHAEGEQGARDGKYRKPHSSVDYWGVSQEAKEQLDKENDEYDLGFRQSQGQHDRLKDEHSLPHGSISNWGVPEETKQKNKRENEAYEAGWKGVDEQLRKK